MKKSIAHAQARILPLCILLWLAPALAEENLNWYGQKDENGATLYYGIAESDYAPLAFTCSRGEDGLIFTYTHEPSGAQDGVEVEVRLQAGDIQVPIRAVGWRLEIDDSFVLEGKTPLDNRLTDLLTSLGELSISVKTHIEKVPLAGAREAVTDLIEVCRKPRQQ